MNKWLIATAGVVAFGALLWWRAQQSAAPVPPIEVVEQLPALSSAREPELPAKPLSEQTPSEEDAPSFEAGEEPVLLSDEASAKAMLYALFMRLEEPMRDWAHTRGLARKDANGTLMLEQPYQQYDDETLAALAANGDMWAQQILAGRIRDTRPAEAMELYRAAAANGSVYAMVELAELSEKIAALSPDFKFEGESAGEVQLDQYYSLRDTPVSPKTTAYAWKAVAEMAGIPGFMGFTGARLEKDEIATACELAGSIYSDLLARRAAAGLGPYPNDPPPAWFDPAAYGQGPGCEHPEAVQFDFSACQEIHYSEPGQDRTAIMYVCDEG